MSRFIAALALSLATGACGVDSDAPQEDRFPLTVEQSADTVRGAFMSSDGVINFLFEQTRFGLRAVLTGEDIQPIDVRIDGEKKEVFPELRHLPELRDRLADAGIDETVLEHIDCRIVRDLRTATSTAFAEAGE